MKRTAIIVSLLTVALAAPAAAQSVTSWQRGWNTCTVVRRADGRAYRVLDHDVTGYHSSKRNPSQAEWHAARCDVPEETEPLTGSLDETNARYQRLMDHIRQEWNESHPDDPR